MPDSKASHIAVLIPAYNQASYLVEAVESVFAQTLLPTQVIVIDDGSTDETPNVLKQLQKKYSSLEVITQANAGVCAASQKGLAAVKAEYVVRLDADDYFPSNYLEVLSGSLHQPKTFAYCDAKLFGAREGWIRARPWSVGALVPENYIHVSALVATAAAREVGYFNPEMNEGFEDWDFFLSLAEAGYNGVYCRETHLYYRQHEGQSRNAMDRTRNRRLRALIAARHPHLYNSIWNRKRIMLWRIKKRLEKWSSL